MVGGACFHGRVRNLSSSAKSAGVAIAIASAFCFGGSGPFAKPLITAGFSPLQVAWLRLAGGALLMLPFALRHAAAVRRVPKLLIGYGLFAIAGVQVFYFASIASVPVGVALLIEFLGPVLVLGWIRFVRRSPVSRSAAIGVAIAMVGLACVVELWAGLSFDPVGLLLALGAAGCQAAYFLLSDSGPEVDPFALAGFGLLLGAVVVTLIAQPWNMDWALLLGDVQLAGQQFPALVAVAWIVVFSTVLAYLTGIVAVRRLSPQVAGAVAFLEPVVATVLAWALLSEALGPVQLLGGALILAGAYVAQRSAPAKTQASELAGV
ncbi:Threonine/homoserine efflux transporter RhtA [Saccharopolyspora antimicrobica]|uniref:Threonine/homoserine efflux transporter RhtA n=1 Tax=Saccharopolyspora antimicrobica TaxID=455193 RepID=A0A1I4QQ93_9PSEU|nr:threonine/homoserine efflux transporter RhtA [Saccharopolyspora antimicrobica]SFM42197.1 Threonine/homoserine efflux transporter RhtA [Saccharopolyspora antimicrobica]